MDSDLYFFESPDIIFQNQQDWSVLLTVEEKKRRKNSKKTGKDNSGFISFKNNGNGLECLRWWKEKCFESCAIDFDANIFGDQLYLDQMPELFTGICDITTPGNKYRTLELLKYHYHIIDKKFYIDQVPLIYFHFSGFRIQAKNQIKLIHGFKRNLPYIFKVYIYEINQVIEEVEKVNPIFNGFAEDDDLKLFWEI